MLQESESREWWVVFRLPYTDPRLRFLQRILENRAGNCTMQIGEVPDQVSGTLPRHYFCNIHLEWFLFEKSRSLRNCFISHPGFIGWDVTSHNRRLLQFSGHFSDFHEGRVGLEKFHQIYLGVQNALDLIFTTGRRHAADGRITFPTKCLSLFPAF